MSRRLLAPLAIVTLTIVGGGSQRWHGSAAFSQSSGHVPIFAPDSSWPKLPPNWGMGVVSSVAVDEGDHVWVLHSPRVGVPLA
jgi:hypothetical protein